MKTRHLMTGIRGDTETVVTSEGNGLTHLWFIQSLQDGCTGALPGEACVQVAHLVYMPEPRAPSLLAAGLVLLLLLRRWRRWRVR